MRFIDLENIYLDVKIIILCALLSKLWSKTSFCIMAGQRNAFAYVSRSKPLKIFFDLLKVPDPSYPVLKFGDDLSSRNRGMAQNVILHICDLERSRSNTRSIKFCTAMRTLPMSIHAKFRWNLMASCFRYGEQIVARKRRRRIKRNSLTDVDILWRKLRHEGEIWRKSDQHVIWRSFPELSFGISWGSIHWAVIEIEPPTLRLKSWELLY